MIDLAYDYNKPQRDACECGEPECLGDAKWFAEATADIAIQIAEQVPGLDSPVLRLVKERNEARELVQRMLKVTEGMTSNEECCSTMLAAHRAAMTWKGGAK